MSTSVHPGPSGPDQAAAARPAGTVAVDPDSEPTRRERLATLLERRLDIPMALLAVVWAGIVAYELVAPASQRATLAQAGNVIWGLFAVEFLTRLVISGHPLRYTVRHWFSLLILLLPALRLLRLAQALRLVRILPAARVIGSSYRAVGTARSLLQGRLTLLIVVTGIVVFGSGQLLYVMERAARDGVASLGDALYWAASLAITNTRVFEPATLPGRLLALVLGVYAIVVVAAVAATLGAFFVERGNEAAEAEA
jgi:voltage-gated potassium channel